MVQTIGKKNVKSPFKYKLNMFLKKVTYGRACFCTHKVLRQPDKMIIAKCFGNENYWHKHTFACFTALPAVEMNSIRTQHGNRS